MALLVAGAAAAATVASTTDSDLAARAAREIRMYPRYTIWDNINLRARDGEIELTGQVSQPFKGAFAAVDRSRKEGNTACARLPHALLL